MQGGGPCDWCRVEEPDAEDAEGDLVGKGVMAMA